MKGLLGWDISSPISKLAKFKSQKSNVKIMKIAIISDTHDNLPNTKKLANWIKKEGIKAIIHCGDIFKPEIIKEIFKVYKGKIYLIFSPADAAFSKIPENSFDNLANCKVFEEFGELKFGNKKIAFCHFPEIAKELVRRQKYDIVFYGHTHKPWLKKIGKTKLANPGNLAGIFYKPTFAIYNSSNDELELKILEKI
jgi:putative phosphoesterase